MLSILVVILAHQIPSMPYLTLKISKSLTGKHSAKMKPRILKTINCPHCEKIGSAANMKRWHFAKCKMLDIMEDAAINGYDKNFGQPTSSEKPVPE